jgi:ribosomal-protein-alanine N-acetyltransferase
MRTVLTTRLVTLEDAPRLAELLALNREFLAPWDPIRPNEYFTPDGQRRAVEDGLERYENETAVPHVILEDGRIVGRVTLSNIVRGAFQSCNMGYWVDSAHNGRGLATGAVGEIMRVAFFELGLHRIEAGTLLHNTASQRVLERNGFIRFGIAPGYLNIAGQWQDHAMYQALNPTDRGAGGGVRLADRPADSGRACSSRESTSHAKPASRPCRGASWSTARPPE